GSSMPVCDGRRMSDKSRGRATWVGAVRLRAAKGRAAAPWSREHRVMSVVVSALIRFALAAALAMLASAAPGEPYPTRPIRLLVSFPPGGASDLIARTLGQPLSVRLGQPVVVENRPGSNGNLAGELAARAAPDGYAVLLAPSSLLAANRQLYAKM